jgi:hypothetical protein
MMNKIRKFLLKERSLLVLLPGLLALLAVGAVAWIWFWFVPVRGSYIKTQGLVKVWRDFDLDDRPENLLTTVPPGLKLKVILVCYSKSFKFYRVYLPGGSIGYLMLGEGDFELEGREPFGL